MSLPPAVRAGGFDCDYQAETNLFRGTAERSIRQSAVRLFWATLPALTAWERRLRRDQVRRQGGRSIEITPTHGGQLRLI